MAVDWNREQHARVEQVLAIYPIASDRCETAAWQLWPIGREVDALAEVWQLLPAEGRYIAPKVGMGDLWFHHHYVVEVQAHCVDALAGAYGTPRGSYLDDHWMDSDALKWKLMKEMPHEPW